jgi:long-chain acyl-CoA synthetase
VQPGDRVSIHAEDRPEWIILDLATVAVRGITVGFYPTNPAAEVEYLLDDCGACVHFAEDEEQFDKVDEIDRSTAPDPAHDHLRRASWHGRRHRRPAALLGQLPRARTRAPGAAPRRRRRADGAARPDDVMTLVYTSGTTGPPKGAMLTNERRVLHRRHRQLEDRVPGGPPNPKDLIVTYLPLCHVAERIFSTWTLVGAGRCSTSPSRSRPSTRTCARCSRRSSSPCRASGRSSTRCR